MSHEVNPRGASPPRQTHAARALGLITDSRPFCAILAHSDVEARPRGARATRRRWPMATGIASGVCRTNSACPARRAAAPHGLASVSRRDLTHRRGKKTIQTLAERRARWAVARGRRGSWALRWCSSQHGCCGELCAAAGGGEQGQPLRPRARVSRAGIAIAVVESKYFSY